jgi:hypothetical protein
MQKITVCNSLFSHTSPASFLHSDSLLHLIRHLYDYHDEALPVSCRRSAAVSALWLPRNAPIVFSTFERELSNAEKRPETKAGSLCCRKKLDSAFRQLLPVPPSPAAAVFGENGFDSQIE